MRNSCFSGRAPDSAAWTNLLEHNDSQSIYCRPEQLRNPLQNYLFRRHDLMSQIEERDIDQLNKQSAP
jgi:hypothetical protein